jgi:5'-methylthioadenosine phosphorylase
MTLWTIGIIGGSGLYDLDGMQDRESVDGRTAWGEPSGKLVRGRIGDVPAAPRPRPPHPPSDLNYRANIAALKSRAPPTCCRSAVGGLRADLPPGTFVVVDQFIDRTFAREKSFFGTGLVAHVSMAHPVCPRLGDHVAGHAAPAWACRTCAAAPTWRWRGRSSAPWPSRLYRSWNCSVIGMTNMPEAKLAREAELCYCHGGHGDRLRLLARRDRGRDCNQRARSHAPEQRARAPRDCRAGRYP